MKTKLEIDEDLKEYLVEEIDRTGQVFSEEFCTKYDVDSFSWQWRFKFENDHGASVIKNYGSYGFEEDKFELAVLWWNGDRHCLDYDTDIADGVIGWLTNQEVMDLLRKIKDLKKEIKKDEN